MADRSLLNKWYEDTITGNLARVLFRGAKLPGDVYSGEVPTYGIGAKSNPHIVDKANEGLTGLVGSTTGFGVTRNALLGVGSRNIMGSNPIGTPMNFKAKLLQDKMKVDNPGGKWLESKLKHAFKRRREEPRGSIGRNLGGSEGVTGYYPNRLKVDPRAFEGLPGAMDEQFTIPGPKLRGLKANIEKEGYKPSPILVQVREDGQAFIVEGNNRVREAIDSRRPYIEADIQYLRGAEKAPGRMHPSELYIFVED